MKHRFFLIILLLIISSTITQGQNGFEKLDINNIETWFSPQSGFFWDGGASGTASYHYPKDSLTSTIYYANLYVTGKDGNNIVHRTNTVLSQPTPAVTQPGCYTCNASDYNKIWKIRRSDLDAFLIDIADGTANNPIPTDILGWPAKGNPHASGSGNVSLTINDALAPFVDVNGDQLYNAHDGDYPDIKGDMALWWVFNDNINNPNLTPLNLEIQCMAYGYANTAIPHLANSIFLDLDMYNKGTEAFDSVSIGLVTDFDIGCYADDYVGSIPQSNTFYGYNATLFDSTNCGDAASYYGNAPIQTVTFLNQNMDVATYYSNDDTLSQYLSNKDSFYEFLQGNWPNSTGQTPMTIGGNGRSGVGVPTTYAFDGNPSDPMQWSMCSAGMPGKDYRGVGVTGNHELPIGGQIELDMVLTTYDGIALPCPDIGGMKHNISFMQQLYDADSLDLLVETTQLKTTEYKTLNVFPNPTDGNLTIDLSDKSITKGTVELYDMSGRTLHSVNFSNQSILQLEMSTLPSGNYILQLSTKDKVYREKISKL